VGADIGKAEEVEELFAKSQAAFGDIGVVVNSAGIMPLAPIAKGDIDAFDRVIATNLRGSYLIMNQAANHVVDGGRIVMFSSSVLAKNFPGYGAYIASKEGVEGLTRVLANELGQRKITVNAVAPGPVATELFLNGKSDEQLGAMAKMVPLGRIGEVDDIQGVVAFLVSKDAGWINGQIVRVNGGFA
jgi:3-oxoacyl-[acyl-carrier protein] reductase